MYGACTQAMSPAYQGDKLSGSQSQDKHSVFHICDGIIGRPTGQSELQVLGGRKGVLVVSVCSPTRERDGFTGSHFQEGSTAESYQVGPG